jgi:hypothetical protein
MKLKVCLYLLIASSILFTAVSCNRDNNDVPDAAPKVAHVAFFNLIPYSDAILFYVNGTRQNTNKISYGDYSGYMNVNSGLQTTSFKTDSLRTEIVQPAPYTVPTDSTTLFVTGKSNAVTVIITRDTALVDTGNVKPKLRFVHTAADAPTYDVLLNNVTIANQSYKSISKFARVDTGRVTLKLNLAGTNTTIINSKVTLQPHSVYTLFIYGSITGTGVNGLNLGIIANH